VNLWKLFIVFVLHSQHRNDRMHENAHTSFLIIKLLKIVQIFRYGV